jgi:hypothetical protein
MSTELHELTEIHQSSRVHEPSQIPHQNSPAADPEHSFNLDAPVRLQPLTFVAERDGVMVGRPDTGSYAVLPTAGAAVLRRLQEGATLREAARAWDEAIGTPLDIPDFLDTVETLGFVVRHGEEAAVLPAVRWQRLGRALFSPIAMLAGAGVVAAAGAAVVRDPALAPSYEHMFFTSHIAVIPVVLALGQFPLLLLHEAFHALAARRLGLSSTLGVGRRFTYLVAETRLDALYSVPRRQRYLPFLAGAWVDLVGTAVLTLLAAAARHDNQPRWLSELLLAFALSGLLRIAWECLFYLETDFYFVVNAATGCEDLHRATRTRFRARVRRLLRRPPPSADLDDDFCDRDLAVARWFEPFMVLGYGVSVLTLVTIVLPAAWRFWRTVWERLTTADPLSTTVLLDTWVFVALTAGQLGLFGYVLLRDFRNRRAST